MQLEFFVIPARDPAESAEELSRFLGGHRVVSTERKLIEDGANSFWSVCVEWTQAGDKSPTTDRKSRVDYREKLSEADFTVFAKLRTLRKDLSEREKVPAYALFTNEQLAEMVRSRVTTPAGLQKLEGVGPAKVEKYGQAFLDLLQTEFAPEPDQPEAAT